jgi:hypothetical protein
MGMENLHCRLERRYYGRRRDFAEIKEENKDKNKDKEEDRKKKQKKEEINVAGTQRVKDKVF